MQVLVTSQNVKPIIVQYANTIFAYYSTGNVENLNLQHKENVL